MDVLQFLYIYHNKNHHIWSPMLMLSAVGGFGSRCPTTTRLAREDKYSSAGSGVLHVIYSALAHESMIKNDTNKSKDHEEFSQWSFMPGYVGGIVLRFHAELEHKLSSTYIMLAIKHTHY
jgi:hypothetical protein